MGRSNGKSTTKSAVPDRAKDRGRLLQHLSNERKSRSKPPTWERLASILFNDALKADYVQCLLQDQAVPEDLRTWPTSSELRAGVSKRARSGSAKRPPESSGGGQETGGIESGAANAGGAVDQSVAEGREANLFLGAIIVLMNQPLGGKEAFFVSTLQLQRTALDVCAVCRSVPSLTLRVTNATLERLQPGLSSPSRVPILRPSSLRGKNIKKALSTNNQSGIDCTSASRITFGTNFNKQIDEMFTWPSSLRQLEFGIYFDQPIVSVKWPQSLELLIFHGIFNQPVKGISWPRCLRELDLGLTFNQPIEDITWPTSLRILRFGPCFNQPIARVEWPPIAELELEVDFDQPITQVGWPESLQLLTLGDAFNHEIEHVKWPRLLRKLGFGDMFNKPIENVLWPAGLKKLTFACKFDQAIERVTWPLCLEVLEFGDDFNMPIAGANFPASLQTLIFGGNFCQPVHNISWPHALQYLHLKNNQYAGRFERTVWPRSVKVTIGPETSFSVCSQESWSDCESP